MESLIRLLQDIGAAGLHVYWLPVGIWTVVALVAALLLGLFEQKVAVVYQYHVRAALLLGLAAGVAGSALLYLYPGSGAAAAGGAAKFIVIQNPITVTAAAPVSSAIGEPTLWIGVLTGGIALLAAAALLRLVADFWALRSFARSLDTTAPGLRDSLNPNTRRQLNRYRGRVTVCFSGDVSVPCTFGWIQRRIVLPAGLADQPEKLNMAVRHELTHIQNSDFLIHTAMKLVKALFFFHPLVHRLAARVEEYREIYCDQQVLQHSDISQKNYARMLLDLSPKTVFKTSAAVTMAVHPSTLKKRIESMKSSTPALPSFRWSIMLMMASALLVTGLMACSDIEEGGITSSEVEDVQADMHANIDVEEGQPLYILNGEAMDSRQSREMLSRLKPKYIESIEVLKGASARSQYGDKGKNGVIKISLHNKEKALRDLLEEPPAKPSPSSTMPNGDDIFVAVQDAPKIKGGQRALYQNLTYPQSCKEAGIQGRVIVQFIVTRNGEVTQAEVLQGIGGGCDQAALQAVRALTFEPGRQRGQAVNVRYSLPILFQLDDGDTGNNDTNTSGTTAMNNTPSQLLNEVMVIAYGAQPTRDPYTIQIPPVSEALGNR